MGAIRLLDEEVGNYMHIHCSRNAFSGDTMLKLRAVPKHFFWEEIRAATSISTATRLSPEQSRDLRRKHLKQIQMKNLRLAAL